MKKLWILITGLLICLTACSPNKTVVTGQPFCPAPQKPVLQKVDVVTVKTLLDELLNVVEYSRGLELQVKCYEAVYGTESGVEP